MVSAHDVFYNVGVQPYDGKIIFERTILHKLYLYWWLYWVFRGFICFGGGVSLIDGFYSFILLGQGILYDCK